MTSFAAWLKIARLQFYPMVVIMYALGAALAWRPGGGFDWAACVLTYACLFLIELATVMTNELFDYDSDVVNTNAGPFTGGSRVLVDGMLTPRQVRNGIVIVLALLGAGAAALTLVLPEGPRETTLGLLVVGLVLGLGYTAPPLRLSYRGLGEIDVAFTHSFYVILVGFAAQTGLWHDPLPFVVGAPGFFAVLSANTLAGIPDCRADASVNKRSYCVMFGARGAAVIAMVSALAAAGSAVWLWLGGVVTGWIGAAVLITVPHAFALLGALVGFIRSRNYDRRIDPIMINALNFIIWFGLIPLIYFLWHIHATA